MFGAGRRDRLFFDLFASQARVSCEAAVILNQALSTLADLPERVAKIKSLEHQGDELAHRIFNESARVFVTPLDREDLHALASSLDDVLDNIDAAAARLTLYKIGSPIPFAADLAQILIGQTEILRDNVGKVRESDHLIESCIKIHALENEGDKALHAGLTRIFDDVADPILLIKQKEILETLEAATDRCEDVANVLETIVLKNA
jgi:predicted phosphate transport protein (TIGR00153 family)